MLLGVIILALWLFFPYLIQRFYAFYFPASGIEILASVATLTGASAPVAPVDLTSLGQFGDSFGALNTLFSAFTVLGVGVGVWLQKTALDDARKQIEKDKQHQEKLSFEATFF